MWLSIENSGSSSQWGINSGLRDLRMRWWKVGYLSTRRVLMMSRYTSGSISRSIHIRDETVCGFLSHSL